MGCKCGPLNYSSVDANVANVSNNICSLASGGYDYVASCSRKEDMFTLAEEELPASPRVNRQSQRREQVISLELTSHHSCQR